MLSTCTGRQPWSILGSHGLPSFGQATEEQPADDATDGCLYHDGPWCRDLGLRHGDGNTKTQKGCYTNMKCKASLLTIVITIIVNRKSNNKSDNNSNGNRS